MIEHMFVEDIRTELESIVTRLDGNVLEPADAEHLLSELTAIERIASAGKSIAARRVADSGSWRRSGERSEADWLAKQTGETVGAARSTLDTAKKLERCPKTSKAFRKGKLSKPQAEAIAGAAAADPDAEDRLLGMAESSALGKLRDECDRVRAAKRDAEATHERIHRTRYWRKWTDRDGARMGQYKLTPEAAAAVEAAAAPFVEAAFQAARATGEHEASEAYAADGLVGMAKAANGGEAGKGVREGTVLVNLESLQRGSVEGDEVCEIPGVGPVPVSVARELLGEAFLKLVIRDGVDIRTVVHLGRKPTAEQRTAAFVRDGGRCVRPTCDRRIQEIDHIDPWSETKHTTLDELGGLCRSDHDLKTHRGHTYRHGPNGWEWTTPDGDVEHERPPPGQAP
jgi:hypothetical protein